MSNYCLYSEVGASILNCNFININEELKELIESGIQFVHLDVMDGNFVDDITFGPSFVKNLIKNYPGVKFEVHMMVKFPMKFIKPMADAGVDGYIFHYEVTKDFNPDYNEFYCEDIIKTIQENNMKPTLAINPETDYKLIESFIKNDLINSILVMTVRPGLGGQKFMESMMEKIKILRKLYPNLDLEVDGGVNTENIKICGESGVNRAVCGSALIKSKQKSKDVLIMFNALFPNNLN